MFHKAESYACMCWQVNGAIFARFFCEGELGWIDVSSVWHIKMLVRKQTIDDDDDHGDGGDDDDVTSVCCE